MRKHKFLVLHLIAFCQSALSGGLDRLSDVIRAGNDAEVGQLLEDNPSLAVTATGNGATALHIAAFSNAVSIAGMLLSHRASLNAATASSRMTPLHIAANANAAEVGRVLLDNGADMQSVTAEGETALHLAADNGAATIAAVLLDHNCSINAVTGGGATALYLAAQGGNEEIVTTLLKHRAATEISTNTEVTPLQVAARNGLPKLMELLVQHGASIHHVAKDGSTALHFAAGKGHAEACQALLMHGAPIEVTNLNGFSPLLSASQNGHAAAALSLLEYRASVQVGSRGEGYMPVHYAAARGSVPLMQYLLRHRAEVTTRIPLSGETPLHVAAMYGQVSVAQFLLDSGAVVDATMPSKATALHLAVTKGQNQVLALLLARGAAPSAIWRLGASVLHEASAGGVVEVVHALLDHLDDITLINLTDVHGDTPLHWAASAGATDVVQLLLKQGAYIDAANRWGIAPLHAACFNGEEETVRMLLGSGSKLADTADQFGGRPAQLLELGRQEQDSRHSPATTDEAGFPADLSTEWRNAALQALTPTERQLLMRRKQPAETSAEQLIRELAIRRRSLTYDRRVRAMFHSTQEVAMLKAPNVLDEVACEVLKTAVDEMPSLREGTTDGMPEHTLHLERKQLQELIGEESVDRLWSLPVLYRQQAQRTSGAALALEQGICNSSVDMSAKEMEIFVRRFSASTRPWIKMHADAAQYTVNVALSDENDQIGGRLLGIFDEGVQIVERGAGDATVHPSSLLHGVTRMEGSGVRYTLIVFFQ